VLERLSPGMTRMGLSFIAAFVIGWAFRVFIKTMLLITVLGTALLLGLSYFGVLNVDFTKARTEYAGAIAWISDQAERLRDTALAYFPSTGGSMVGLLLGLKKK